MHPPFCTIFVQFSLVARGLDRAVEAFHQRRLRDEYVYIFLDRVMLKVRDVRGKVRRRWVRVAYGITVEGRHELIASQLARGESEARLTMPQPPSAVPTFCA